jgi:nitric oxide reductase NorD protein
VESGLGAPEAEAYGDLVVAVAKKDGDLARVIALTLPDQLARVEPGRRVFYFRLLREVLGVRPPALPLVARTLPDLLPSMEDDALRAFLARGLVLHRESHHKAESFLRQESGVGQAAARELERGVSLAEVNRTLTLYARAHCGEDVQVRAGSGTAFSDGHHIYLPERVDRYGDDRDFLVYRVQTALSVGYLEFGTFDLELGKLAGRWPDRADGEGELERYFRAFMNKSLARDLFQILEDARVEGRIRRAYPGVARDLDRLGASFRGDRPDPKAPAARAIEALARHAWALDRLPIGVAEEAAIAPLVDLLSRIHELDVGDVAAAVRAAYPAVEGLMIRAEDGKPPRSDGDKRPQRPGPEGDLPQPEALFEPPPLAPRIRPEQAGGDERRLEDEAQRLLREMRQHGEEATPSDARRQAREADRKEAEGASYEEMEGFLDRNPSPGGAIVDDKGTTPDAPSRAANGAPVDPDVVGGAKTFVYREWDTAIEDYKPRWVTVREQRLKEGSREFVDDVMRREKRHVDALRRRFEAMRPQGLVKHRGLVDGDELDIDRVVEARVARRLGQEPSDRLYIRRVREQRDVAVAFLIDMSSSTNESADGSSRRIIDVEKEALIVAAEALHALGDPFAIWGFSGYGRDHVAFYVAKEFAEPYDDRARERIGRITFKMENRDGAAIRHATAKLQKQPARVRLLFLLSDGKPLDCGCDHYYDRYAQDDTRAALREARKLGIHPFCVTVDPTGPSYLARMYGDVAYTVIDRLDALPARLMRVYGRLAMSGNRT